MGFLLNITLWTVFNYSQNIIRPKYTYILSLSTGQFQHLKGNIIHGTSHGGGGLRATNFLILQFGKLACFLTLIL